MAQSDEKILAGVSHLGILFSMLGIIVALIIYLVQKDRSTFTAHHAKQALGYQVAIQILWTLVGLFAGGSVVGLGFLGSRAPHLFGAMAGLFAGLVSLLSLGLIVYGIYAAVLAFQGREFTYAVIGKYIDRL